MVCPAGADLGFGLPPRCHKLASPITHHPTVLIQAGIVVSRDNEKQVPVVRSKLRSRECRERLNDHMGGQSAGSQPPHLLKISGPLISVTIASGFLAATIPKYSREQISFRICSIRNRS